MRIGHPSLSFQAQPRRSADCRMCVKSHPPTIWGAPLMKDDEARTLRWIEGFAELPAAQIRRIGLQCRWRWYKPDEHIISQEDATNDVFFIVQGKIRITNYSKPGKQISFRD